MALTSGCYDSSAPFFIKNGAEALTVESQPPAAFFGKRLNFWFPILFARPDTAQFRLVNATLLCNFQFPLDVTRELSHNEANLRCVFSRLIFSRWAGFVNTGSGGFSTKCRASLVGPYTREPGS